GHRAQADQPSATGSDRVCRRRWLPLPDHADQVERVAVRAMRVVAVTLRDFRCYAEAQAVLGDGLTVVAGPNGAGKTNLLEALYFGCTGRSCRTNSDRELVRWGAPWTRVAVDLTAEDGAHELTVA